MSPSDEGSNTSSHLINPSLTGLGTISPSPSYEEFKLSEIEKES